MEFVDDWSLEADGHLGTVTFDFDFGFEGPPVLPFFVSVATFAMQPHMARGCLTNTLGALGLLASVAAVESRIAARPNPTDSFSIFSGIRHFSRRRHTALTAATVSHILLDSSPPIDPERP